jgi:hypothetical protein
MFILSSVFLREKKTFIEKNIKMWTQICQSRINPENPFSNQKFFCHDSNSLLNSNNNIIIIWKSACRPAKTRPLINSPSQNEIVDRFPGRVHSLVVHWFPVWTPSQTQTSAIDLCGVNGLVAVHWPNLFETRQVQHDTPIQKNNDNLPKSIRRQNKRLNISSFRPMPCLISNS